MKDCNKIYLIPRKAFFLNDQIWGTLILKYTFCAHDFVFAKFPPKGTKCLAITYKSRLKQSPTDKQKEGLMEGSTCTE